jgi:hypothetical protein
MPQEMQFFALIALFYRIHIIVKEEDWVHTMGVEEGWEKTMPSGEQLTLTSIASQLETYISINNVQTIDEGNVREEAELLMSLLSSKPPSPAKFEDKSPLLPYHYGEEEMIPPDNFSFTCPLLSLDRSSLYFRGDESEDDSSLYTADESLPPAAPPALLLARKMVVDAPDELRSAAEAMACNILQSFHSAVEWRIQQWICSLSQVLVTKEKELLKKDVSEKKLRELLDTPEACLLLCLRKAASEIKVIDASTTFRVLSQRINRYQSGAPPLKKRKVEVPASLLAETEYKYTVAHVLSFESIMTLNTPAGYSEVTFETPGIIEGTFLSSDMGEDILTDVSVTFETNVLAEAIERSSRIVARAATHAIVMPSDEEEEEAPKEEGEPKELAPSPTQDEQTSFLDDAAAIVSPCKTSPVYSSTEDAYVPFPNDFDSDVGVRMVSPQPRSPEEDESFVFTPRKPSPNHKVGVLNLVSPPPQNNQEPLVLHRKSPSLPALVQVACAAMGAC